jgi:hypothetical protein
MKGGMQMLGAQPVADGGLPPDPFLALEALPPPPFAGGGGGGGGGGKQDLQQRLNAARSQVGDDPVSVLEPEHVKFKRLFNNLNRVSGSNMVRACETTTGVIVVFLGDPHTSNWRRDWVHQPAVLREPQNEQEGEYYNKNHICDTTNEWPLVKIEQHDTYQSFQSRQPPYGITEPDMDELTEKLEKMNLSTRKKVKWGYRVHNGDWGEWHPASSAADALARVQAETTNPAVPRGVEELLRSCNLEEYIEQFNEEGYDEVGIIEFDIDDAITNFKLSKEEADRLRRALKRPWVEAGRRPPSPRRTAPGSGLTITRSWPTAKVGDAGLSKEELDKITGSIEDKKDRKAYTTYVLENVKLTATTADVVATCIETFPYSLESFVEGASWQSARSYNRTGMWKTPLYNELYWLINMNIAESAGEQGGPLLVHATDYRSGQTEPIDLLLALLGGSRRYPQPLKQNLLKEDPERFCLAVREKANFMAQDLPVWVKENLQFLSKGKETLYQMHVALCGNPTGVHLRDFLACITTFGCHPHYLTDDLPIPANFVMEDIGEATVQELIKICRYNGYMDAALWTRLSGLNESQAKKELLKAKIKEQNSSENVMKMPVSQIYIKLYSEQYNLAKENGTDLWFAPFLNRFFQELSSGIGDIDEFLIRMILPNLSGLALAVWTQRNVAFDNKERVLTHEGLHVYTTKIAKQLLKLQNQVVHKAFGFVANYLNSVGQMPHASALAAGKPYAGAPGFQSVEELAALIIEQRIPDPPFYGQDYMYDIYTVLRLARRCGYGEPSEGRPAKAIIVIGGEGKGGGAQCGVFHFIEGVPTGEPFMRGHSTNAFKGLYAIGALKGSGRGGTSDKVKTDCVELSGKI